MKIGTEHKTTLFSPMIFKCFSVTTRLTLFKELCRMLNSNNGDVMFLKKIRSYSNYSDSDPLVNLIPWLP